MKPKTLTTFGQLQPGDRFAFVENKRVVFQVTTVPFYNHVVDNRKSWIYDKRTQLERSVLYIRSTILQPNQEGKIKDLPVGAVFCFTHDIVTEYRLDAFLPVGNDACVWQIEKGIPHYMHVECNIIYLRQNQSDI